MKRLPILLAVLACTSAALAQRGRPPADANKAPAAAPKKSGIPDANDIMAKLPEGTFHEALMMPLRDGAKLATDIFHPKGEGPWPVMLLRTPYLRFFGGPPWAMATAPYVLVLQNQRGTYGSEGTLPKDTFDNEPNDNYDAIEWAAQQKWCNGKVGMFGASGNGISPMNALWCGAPHLTAVDVNISADNAYLYWCFSNGARRKFYSWMSARGQKVPDWPRPTTMLFDWAKRNAFLAERAPKCKVPFNANAGWFDLFSEGALDAFAAVAPNGKSHLTIGPSAHGGCGGIKFPNRNQPAAAMGRKIQQWMTESDPASSQSVLLYYLMGDANDAAAPGNLWLTSNKWPVDHTPTSYYMHKDGTLSPQAPKEKDASTTFTYDPRDPVKSVGGNYDTTDVDGPWDQRPLKDRKDILRFVTPPLDQPVGVVGKIWVELHVSSDAPDTMFTAKLIDIYPDGYEAVFRASAMLARYSQGLDKPAPLEKGKVYKLSMDCWSTALVFNKGHRIAVYVSSSDTPEYEVHPNTYDPAASIDKGRVAQNTIHLSADHASKVILPVIAPELYLKAGAGK
jgi:predicted acyl esterase